ncbi:CBM_collapsed_G0033610.mRNA.1.CDS.1 [Saccharomyces cerevisiae]|nr:CBM_collapsed_G0033610.mRNA.1.CDS.1 [Saccharomyces cerevisiae]
MSSSITDEKISGEQQQPAGRKLYYNTSTFAEPPLVDGEGNPINYEPEVYNPDHEKLYHNPSLPAQSIQDTRDDELLERVYSQDQGVEYEEDEEDKPNLSAASIKSYALTRFTSLLHIHEFSWENVNPIPELRKMTWQNWNYFFMGYFAWLSAAWAFFCVSVSVAPLAELYDRPTKDITWGLGLVLFVRSAGAVIFGLWTDKSSRKWPLLWPETKYFTKVLKARKLILSDAVKANGGEPLPKANFKQKMVSMKRTVQKYWLLFAYLVVLLVGPNYLTHASQDLLPTMLRAQLGLSKDAVTVIVVVTNIGAICGGSEKAILGAGFMLYFCVFGVWGILPIHLAELAPADARALVAGLSYQLGNLASAAASTIETQLADRYPLERDASGAVIKEDYAKVMAILTGSVFIFTFACVFVGHEKFHRDLSSPVMKKYINQVEEYEADGLSISDIVEQKTECASVKMIDSNVSKTYEEHIETV